MRVAVMGFGSVWRNRLGKVDAHGHLTGAVYYNTTGVLVRDKVRQRPQICGYARFDSIGGFDPNHPPKMIGRVFDCAEPSVWMGCNKLLFRRVLNPSERADCFLVVAKSAVFGQLAIGKKDWRSPETWLLSFSECAGQQEALLLMSVGAWLRTDIGQFKLECQGTPSWFGRLVLQTE